MIKYFCTNCGECFSETQADTHKELIDYFAGYGNLYEHYIACPECGSTDVDELSLDKECEKYDDEFGCEGICDECPLTKEEGEES